MPPTETDPVGLRRRTRHGLRMDDRRTARRGRAGRRADWMDARVPAGRAVTPRIGQTGRGAGALEINALAAGAEADGTALGCSATASADRLVHRPLLESGDRVCLNDVVDVDHRRGCERPGGAAVNQDSSAAGGLPIAVLDSTQAGPRAVVDQVERRLLSDRIGLRTLEPGRPGLTAGTATRAAPRSGDAAYHQGRSGRGLLGPFVRGLGPGALGGHGGGEVAKRA